MTAQSVAADELGAILDPLIGDALFGFDVDGVLAPIVEHAEDAVLSDGVAGALIRLAARTPVAVVSGRSLASLERRFTFPPSITVVGSHGLEWRDEAPVALDDAERRTLEQLTIIATKAVEAIGTGAWLETKPASVVIHTRSAAPGAVGPALDAATRLAEMVPGAHLKPGHQVVELMARSTTKGDTLLTFADRLGARPIVYLGDDVTDEEAFAMLGADDVTVRVGPGDTLASYRLDGPADVVDLLEHLVPGAIRSGERQSSL